MSDIIQEIECVRGDPEALMSLVDDILKHREEITHEVFCAMIEGLSQAAEATWWRCGCGVISPERGEVDAICDRCGEFCRLGQRLSRPVWPLYVRCLKRADPEGWFDWLSNGLTARGLGKMYDQGGVLPEAIATEGSRVLPEAIAARGAVPPVKMREIQCIDGMLIDEGGNVRGCGWIALPVCLIAQ